MGGSGYCDETRLGDSVAMTSICLDDTSLEDSKKGILLTGCVLSLKELEELELHGDNSSNSASDTSETLDKELTQLDVNEQLISEEGDDPEEGDNFNGGL